MTNYLANVKGHGEQHGKQVLEEIWGRGSNGVGMLKTVDSKD